MYRDLEGNEFHGWIPKIGDLSDNLLSVPISEWAHRLLELKGLNVEKNYEGREVKRRRIAK